MKFNCLHTVIKSFLLTLCVNTIVLWDDSLFSKMGAVARIPADSSPLCFLSTSFKDKQATSQLSSNKYAAYIDYNLGHCSQQYKDEDN